MAVVQNLGDQARDDARAPGLADQDAVQAIVVSVAVELEAGTANDLLAVAGDRQVPTIGAVEPLLKLVQPNPALSAGHRRGGHAGKVHSGRGGLLGHAGPVGAHRTRVNAGGRRQLPQQPCAGVMRTPQSARQRPLVPASPDQSRQELQRCGC